MLMDGLFRRWFPSSRFAGKWQTVNSLDLPPATLCRQAPIQFCILPVNILAKLFVVSFGSYRQKIPVDVRMGGALTHQGLDELSLIALRP